MIKKLLSSQLRLNMVSGVVMTIVGTAITIISFPVYLHFLGYEKYGVWLVLATVLTFAQLGNLGIGHAVTKFVAEEYGRSNIEGIQQYVSTALALLCFIGTIILLMILALKNQIVAVFKLSDENVKMVSWLLPYIGVLSIYVFIVDTLNATLSGLGRMDLANYIQSVGRILFVTVVTVFLYSGRGIESLLIGNTLLNVFIHVVSLIFIWRIARVRFLRIKNIDTQCCKRLMRFGGAVFGGSLISMLFSPFNKLMLSRYAGVSTIPVYEIAFNGSMQVRGLIEAGFRAFVPEISRIGSNMTAYAKDRISAINRRAMVCITYSFALYVFLFIFATPIFKIWLRQQFVITLPTTFKIMLAGTFMSLVGVPAYYTLMGMGCVRHNLVSHIIQSTVNVVVLISCILLTSTVPLNTVALSVACGMGASTVYLFWQKRRVLKRLTGRTLVACQEGYAGL